MYLTILLKATKNQSFNLSLKDTFLNPLLILDALFAYENDWSYVTTSALYSDHKQFF